VVQPGLFDEEARKDEAESTKYEVRSTKPEEPDFVLRTLDLRVFDASRPSGARFGELVHGVLATAPLAADRTAIDRVAEVQGRILAALPDEIAAAATAVERVLAHELLGRARAAEARGACRRETPVTCTLPDGSLMEGVVDLAFEEDGTWVIVDYKTDRDLAASGADRYRRQIALYGSAIAQATRQRATGVMVRV
jgi:ATP-dependent exoDNAse (exonuclease V) beta subunit